MSFTPGPEQTDELKEFEAGLDAIDQMKRPWRQRGWDLPCFAVLAAGEVVRRRWSEWRGRS